MLGDREDAIAGRDNESIVLERAPLCWVIRSSVPLRVGTVNVVASASINCCSINFTTWITSVETGPLVHRPPPARLTGSEPS